MKELKISELITDKISGEWGKEGVSENAVNVIRTANFSNTGEIRYDNLVKRDISQKKINQKQLKKGDVLIEKSGGGPKQPVGRVVYFNPSDNDTYLCNNFTSVLRPNPNLINPRFFFYALFFNYKAEKVLNYQNKTTGIINLKLDRYLTEKIRVPNLKVQEQIVSVLDKAQGLIHKREQSISLLDELSRATFLDMFGDPSSNNKNWSLVSLNKFGNIITGNTPPRSNPENYKNGIVDWAKTNNIVRNELYVTKSDESLSVVGLEKGRTVEEGALLVACIAGSISSIGRAALVTKKTAFNQQINAIQPNKKTNPLFLYWLFKLSDKYIQDFATKGMKRIITKGVFQKIKLIQPDFNVQLEFGVIATRLQSHKETLNESLKEANNLFQSLLQEAFSGSLKIKDNKLALQSALDKIKWFDEQIKQVTSNTAIEKLQKQMDAFNKISKPFDQITKLQKQLDKLKIPNLDKINAFQKSLEKLNSPQLKAIKNFEQFNRLKENEFLKKISDDQAFKIKSFEEFQETEKQRKLEEELKKESDPVLQFIGSEQIGKFTVDNYKINVARAIHKLFGKREFDIDSLVEALKNEKGIINVRKAAVKKDLFKIFKEFIVKKHYGMFSFESMRQSMKKNLFNPSFELLQEFIDSEMKLKSEDKLSQVYFNDLHKDPSDPYYNDKSLFEKNRTFQLYEERIYLQYKIKADED